MRVLVSGQHLRRCVCQYLYVGTSKAIKMSQHLRLCVVVVFQGGAILRPPVQAFDEGLYVGVEEAHVGNHLQRALVSSLQQRGLVRRW